MYLQKSRASLRKLGILLLGILIPNLAARGQDVAAFSATGFSVGFGLGAGPVFGRMTSEPHADTFWHIHRMDNVGTGTRIASDSESFDLKYGALAYVDLVLNGRFAFTFHMGYLLRGGEFGTEPNPVATTNVDVALDVETLSFPFVFRYLFSRGPFIPYVGIVIDPYLQLAAELDSSQNDIDLTAVKGVAKTINTLKSYGVGLGPVLGAMYLINPRTAIELIGVFSFTVTEVVVRDPMKKAALDSLDGPIVIPEPHDPHVHLFDIWLMLRLTFYTGASTSASPPQ